jgi:hypothetical protein
MTTRTLPFLFAAAIALAGCQEAEESSAAKSSTAAKATSAHPAGHECSGDCANCDKGQDCPHKASGQECGAAAEGGHECGAAAAGGHECGGDCAGCDKGADCAHKADGHECGSAEGEGHDCSGGADTKLAADQVVERTDATGRKVMHAGQEFTQAAPVAVAELVKNHAAYLGKTVQVEGDIMAMCTHKRGWLALVGKDDQSGAQLRAFTAPVFLVPADSIGKSVRIEGTVDEVEVPAEMAKHFAKEHQLDMPEGDGPVKQAVIRATAADFWQ